MLESLKPGKQLAEITEITEMSDSSNLSDQLSSILSQKHENIFKNNIDENVDEVEGLDYLKKCSKFTEEELSTLDRKVRWKIDVWITPRISFKYTLQFLDKLSLNYAAAYSFNKDLIVDQSYSWVAAIFNFGYLAGAKNEAGILVLRFLLGILECCISLSCMALNSNFYKRSEQPLRMCFFLSFNGIATIIGVILSYGLGYTSDSNLAPLKLIFLTNY